MTDPGCFNVLPSAGDVEAIDVISDIELLKTMRLSTTSMVTALFGALSYHDELLWFTLKVDGVPLNKIPERNN